ncbi:uncharacterized protein SETTUDRAFT_102236 [Exserohilum turcica Et28A]|uniref:Rhodopsin domain-containing protein n=1 Tax=Exserohilum turcicum (strain 28A) TaxID=671987 RepID=R0J2F1_EXST2|nr:uncharacterized protein SETTUDRAFT_102236 [Exserohilum turcica Et28A]EOA90941.1 hypothetical protein SETTUDRAFT_102236 [Exserohilum turcica Et28A]
MPNVNGTITIMPPPEGYVVNFENPQRRLTTASYTLFIVENILALLFLAQRLYTKIHLMKQFQIDDVLIIIAWMCSVATQALLIVGFVSVVIGVHAWEISIQQYGYYSRVCFQMAVWTTVFICAGAYTAIFFSLVFACKPIAASWNPLLLATATCSNRGAIYITTAVVGIVTDVILMIIPIPTIWGLQMPTKQKIGLTIMFAIGSITMVTSIIRLVVLMPALTNPDQTWVIGVGSLWIIVEANLFVICCCLPTLRRFFRHVAPRLIGEGSRQSSGEDSSGRNRGLRSWGTTKVGPKRQYDTLMNTIDGGKTDGDDEIPLSSVDTKEQLRTRESKVQVGARECKGDNDSEEAILYERTVEVTYEGVQPAHPTNPQNRQVWTGGRDRVSQV